MRRGASSSRCSAARRRRGRSRRARSSRAHAARRRAHAMAANDAEGQAASRLSRRRCSNWAGPSAAKCSHRLSLGRRQGRYDTKICGGTGRARAGRHSGLSSTALAPLLEATRTVPIVFAGVADPVRPAMSRAWRGRAGTPPASCLRIFHRRKMAGAAQADRATRDASGSPSRDSASLRASASSAASRRSRRRSGSSCAPSMCATPARSNAPSRLSRRFPIVA